MGVISAFAMHRQKNFTAIRIRHLAVVMITEQTFNSVIYPHCLALAIVFLFSAAPQQAMYRYYMVYTASHKHIFFFKLCGFKNKFLKYGVELFHIYHHHVYHYHNRCRKELR